MKLGIGHKIAAFTSALIFLIGAGLFAVVIYEEQVVIHDLRIEESFQYATRTSSLVDDHLYALNVRELRRAVSSILEGGGIDLVWVLDEEGRLLADGTDNPALRNQKPSIPLIGALIAAKDVVRDEDETYHWSGVPVVSGDGALLGYVVVAFAQERIDERLRANLISQLIVLGPALLLGVLAAFFFGHRIAGPLETLTAAAGQIGVGNWDVKVSVDSNDEVGELARSINAMAENLSQIAVSRDNLENIVEEKTVQLRQHQDNLEELVEKRTLELTRAKKEAEKANTAKSEFLSSMSHELRTPLNAILGFTQLIQLDPSHPLTPEQKESTDQIIKGGTHLLELIDQVLELAKIEAGKMTVSIEPVSVRELLGESIDMVQTMVEKRNIDLNIDIGNCPDVNVKADLTRLKQVLLNLLSNAVKYNNEGGSISVNAEVKSGDCIHIAVTDTGPGIPKDQQEGVFQPFNRLGHEASEIEGTGIGLVIAREMLHMMKGEIGFESEVGKGSTFWIEVPLDQQALANAAQTPYAQNATPDLAASASIGDADHHYTILYVEDNPANQQLVEKIIGRMPYVDLILAHNAELGLEMAETNKPDLILLDINLPGMDGYEALERLRINAETSSIPVIAVTAQASKAEITRGRHAGFKGYITKPIQIPEFIQTIKETLER